MNRIPKTHPYQPNHSEQYAYRRAPGTSTQSLGETRLCHASNIFSLCLSQLEPKTSIGLSALPLRCRSPIANSFIRYYRSVSLLPIKQRGYAGMQCNAMLSVVAVFTVFVNIAFIVITEAAVKLRDFRFGNFRFVKGHVDVLHI